MLDCDISYSKLTKFIKNDDELFKLKKVFILNYKKIHEIFLYYAGISTYPVISWNDFTTLANHCRLPFNHKALSLATLDRLFITTNVSTNKYSSSAERSL